MIILHI